jgi:hypothetical protein
MAAEKQPAANRENAKRSTGPKTVAGRLISSRNAYRHGFSCPLPFDPATLAKVDALAHALAGKEADQERLMTAAEFAEAQLELSRIRATRTALIAKIEFVETDMQELRRLLALDRYERYAHTKWRRASVKLADVGAMEGS